MILLYSEDKNFPALVDEKKSGKWKMENGKRRLAGDTELTADIDRRIQPWERTSRT